MKPTSYPALCGMMRRMARRADFVVFVRSGRRCTGSRPGRRACRCSRWCCSSRSNGRRPVAAGAKDRIWRTARSCTAGCRRGEHANWKSRYRDGAGRSPFELLSEGEANSERTVTGTACCGLHQVRRQEHHAGTAAKWRSTIQTQLDSQYESEAEIAVLDPLTFKIACSVVDIRPNGNE